MNTFSNRRDFLRRSAAGGALLGVSELSFLSKLSPVTAAEAQLESEGVRLRPEIEPIVRLLENTGRSRVLEEVAARIKRGLQAIQHFFDRCDRLTLKVSAAFWKYLIFDV